MPGDVSWQLSGSRATLLCGGFRASLDALAPPKGMGDVSLLEARLPDCQILGIDFDPGGPSGLREIYQRGGDLIASYAQTADRPFAVVVYWRAGLTPIGSAPHPYVDLPYVDLPYVDLLVSIETSLLDMRPLLAAHSWLAAPIDQVTLRPAAGYCLGRFSDSAISYIELRHPDDALTTALAASGEGTRLTTQLLGQPLEKGVLLRSRLRGLFVPRADDERLAEAALAEFARSAPPLTA